MMDTLRVESTGFTTRKRRWSSGKSEPTAMSTNTSRWSSKITETTGKSKRSSVNTGVSESLRSADNRGSRRSSKSKGTATGTSGSQRLSGFTEASEHYKKRQGCQPMPPCCSQKFCSSPVKSRPRAKRRRRKSCLKQCPTNPYIIPARPSRRRRRRRSSSRSSRSTSRTSGSSRYTCNSSCESGSDGGDANFPSEFLWFILTMNSSANYYKCNASYQAAYYRAQLEQEKALANRRLQVEACQQMTQMPQSNPTITNQSCTNLKQLDAKSLQNLILNQGVSSLNLRPYNPAYSNQQNPVVDLKTLKQFSAQDQPCCDPCKGTLCIYCNTCSGCEHCCWAPCCCLNLCESDPESNHSDKLSLGHVEMVDAKTNTRRLRRVAKIKRVKEPWNSSILPEPKIKCPEPCPSRPCPPLCPPSTEDKCEAVLATQGIAPTLTSALYSGDFTNYSSPRTPFRPTRCASYAAPTNPHCPLRFCPSSTNYCPSALRYCMSSTGCLPPCRVGSGYCNFGSFPCNYC